MAYVAVALLLGCLSGAFGLICAGITFMVTPAQRLAVGTAALACLAAGTLFLLSAWWLRRWETRLAKEERERASAPRQDVSDRLARPAPQIIRVPRSPRRAGATPKTDSAALRWALAASRGRFGRPPKVERIHAILRKAERKDPSRPCIVCFDVQRIPAAGSVGNIEFEPEIITPTETVWKLFVWVALAVVVGAFWLLDALGLMPWGSFGVTEFYRRSGMLDLVIGAGLVALGLWAWRAAIRPTYLRLAPGMVQLLRYRYFSSKPALRSYPIDAKTLVIVTQGARELTFTLTRDGFEDRIRFKHMRRPKVIADRVWQALLSTAPTPPLSDEELVG